MGVEKKEKINQKKGVDDLSWSFSSAGGLERPPMVLLCPAWIVGVGPGRRLKPAHPPGPPSWPAGL